MISPEEKPTGALFRVHLDTETVEEIRKSTNGNFALGGERFETQIEGTLGRRARREHWQATARAR